MAERLYPDKNDRDRLLSRSGATSAALRLAQEFEVAFGRSTLIEFIRDAIRDDDFTPGELHTSLLDLPWSDVFTTNYDRLLEVTARRLWKRHYESVLTIADLPIARRPRIVKLHGTLPDLCQMVLTEDDFREYPHAFAPFVTAVQGTLTENVLCLIGFSGDDPNFLAWTGWLRDELGSAIPKTYLFTGKDDLKPFQRRLYEERNIIPIPLMSLAKSESYEEAFRWLFLELGRPAGETPTSWNIGPRYTRQWADSAIASEPQGPPKSESDWINAAIVWNRHRLQYRNWCVLHQEGAERLEWSTEFWIGRVNSIPRNKWNCRTSLFVLRELVWRWSTALQPLRDDFVFEVLDPVLREFAASSQSPTEASWEIAGAATTLKVPPSELNEAYVYLLRECLRHSREIARDERFSELVLQLEETKSLSGNDWNETQAYISHQRVLNALGRLKGQEARQLLQVWDTTQCDVIWAIRRAGLCLECGLHSLGKRLLVSTLDLLRSGPVSDQLDMHQMSAEGLVLDLLDTIAIVEAGPRSGSADQNGQGMLDRLSELRVHGCDPNVFQKHLTAVLDAEPRRTQGIFEIEGFGIGSSRVETSGGSEKQLVTAYRAIRFVEDAGMPLFVPHSRVGGVATVAENVFICAVKTIAFFVPQEGSGLVLRCRDKNALGAIFSRSCLAQLSAEQVRSLVAAVESALTESIGELARLSETEVSDSELWERTFTSGCLVLSRLLVRLDDERNLRLAQRIIALPQEPGLRNRSSCQQILATCIDQIVASLRRDAAAEILPNAFSTPIPTEPGFPHTARLYGEWSDITAVAEPFDWPVSSSLRTQCGSALDELMTRLGVATKDTRTNISLRLVHAFNSGLLSTYQKEQFVTALFKQRDVFGFPTETGCYDSVILLLPKFDGFNETRAFREKYLESEELAKDKWSNLARSVYQPGRAKQRSVHWNVKDLTKLVSQAEEWFSDKQAQDSKRAQKKSHFLDAWFPSSGETLPSWLSCVERCVLLNPRSTTELRRRIEQLIQRAEEAGWCVAQIAPARAKLTFLRINVAVARIQESLAGRDWETVSQGCAAIDQWISFAQHENFAFPAELVDTVISIIQFRRHEHLSPIIHIARHFLDVPGVISVQELFRRLEGSLDALLIETRYDNAALWTAKIGFTIGTRMKIRLACIRLAKAFRVSGIEAAVIESWHQEIETDLFADVRRAVDE